MAAKVYIAVPTHDGSVLGMAYPGLLLPATSDSVESYRVYVRQNSLLAHNFNWLFCDCVNDGRFTHFAMHHADIEAPENWLGEMVEVMTDHGLDVLSAAVAIKDSRGLTSMGHQHPGGMVRRLVNNELRGWPGVIGSHPDLGDVIVNTGLMVVKLGEWVHKFPGFEVRTGIVTTSDGQLTAVNDPEDWRFSRWCHENGLKVAGYQLSRVVHWGKRGFTTAPTPGGWERDMVFRDDAKIMRVN